jgi:Oxidoreductase molybdopterin binding domain
VRSFTTDPDLPLSQGRYASPLRTERVAAVLGVSLGVLFAVCFVTGLYSHLHQHPQGALPIPPRPAGLYRLTQGLHVATGIASIPVLLAKLWVVWPRFVSFPPARDAAHAVERVGLLPLVGGGVFLLFSGTANVAQWYPWRFSFTAAHFWTAWMVVGALIAHVGAKWAVSGRALRRGHVDDADTAAAPGTRDGLTRRSFLGVVAGASGILTLATVGQTVSPLRRLSVLAPRDPSVGSQGRPVNRGARNARVVEAARDPSYRLEVSGRVQRPLSLTADELVAMALHDAELPIACVEGWSFSARWQGVRVRDLLAAAGAAPGRTVLVESLEPAGAYRTSTLNRRQAADRDTLLATHIDGERLSLDHGFPCRLIAPNRPGVLQTKWVRRVVVL